MPYYKVDSISRIEYTEGMLAIDVFDVKRRTPVWHAYGEKRLSRAEQSGRADNSEAAVAMILSGFPPTSTPAQRAMMPEENQVSETLDTCGIIQSENWAAWINAMPGPKGPGGKLIVTGDVTFPTAGYSVELISGRADRSLNPIQQMILKVDTPDGPAAQVLTTLQARYEGPAIAPQYKGVHIICDGEVIVEINEVEKIS